jgi:hypothetical protein
MTSAVLGANSYFKIGTAASPTAYTTIAEILSIGAIGQTASEVDVTNMDSTAMEYISGLADGNSVEISMNFLAGNTQHEQVRDGVGTTHNIQIVWSDASTATFQFVQLGFNRDESTPTDQLKASVSGRITGAIVWA